MAIDTTPKSPTAVAYGPVVDADAYFLARGIAAWTGTDPAKEESLISGQDYLHGLYAAGWFGIRTTQDQALDWPRAWLVDLDGYPIDADLYPLGLVHANFEAALLILTGTDLEPVLVRGGSITKKSVKAAVVATTTEYVSGAPARSVITKIEGLLAGLVSLGTSQPLLRV